jgi:hypothetical protein
MVGIKTTGEQISILCHNGTIFVKPREKTGLAIIIIFIYHTITSNQLVMYRWN